MKPLNLNDTERMARVGRLTVLKSERRKSAEKLRDAMVAIINDTHRSTDYDQIIELVSYMKSLDELKSGEDSLPPIK